MKKTLGAGAFVVVACGFAGGVAQAADPAPAPDYTITANVGLSNEYRFRGLSQTNFKPAISGGFDFAHSSGFYLGNWNSNISWISDAGLGSAPIEMDFYGGYKFEAAPGFGVDVGVLQYYYPGSYNAGVTKPNTTELYAAFSYGPATIKYSHSLTDTFGFDNAKNSYYAEFNVNYPLDFYGLTVNGHVGYQKIKGQGTNDFDYTDWKLGLTKDLGNGFSIAAAYIDTNAKDAGYINYRGKNLGKATGVVTLSKVF